MNLNAHVLRLQQIREKMDRGEELSERDVAYVRALWERVMPVVRRLAQSIASAAGTDVEGLAGRLERENMRRQRMRAEYEARMRRWGRV